MKTFLERVLASMMESGTPLEDQMLVLPSRRAITFYRSLVAQQIDRPIFLPRLLTMEDLAQTVSGLQPLDQVTTALELYDSYREIYKEAEPYETFESWTGAILRDFNTIDTYLLDAQRVFRDLRLIKEINDWSFASDELLGDQVAFNEFWQRLGLLYRRFNDRLLAQGLSYSGGIMRAAASLVTQSKIFPETKRVTIAGFNAISPAEIAILDQLQSEERLHVHWDSAPFYTDNHQDPAGLFLRRWKEKKWNQQFGLESTLKTELKIAAHPHAVSQAQWAGAILAYRLEEPGKTALVLADEKLLTPILDRFPAELAHVNITIGLSVRETSVYKFLNGFYRLHIDAQRIKTGQGNWALRQEDLRIWAEVAVRFNLLNESNLRKIEAVIDKERLAFISQDRLSQMLGADLLELLGLDEIAPSSVISASLRILGAIRSDDPIVMGVATRLSELLTHTSDITERYQFIDGIESLWRCIKGGLGRERINFIGEPLQGLQVMGLLETRALDFDCVILLGANEGTLPKSQRFESFLPFDLRRYYGLPTQQEEDAVFAYYFYRLIQGARQVHIAFTAERDELGGGEQSRYLSQLQSNLPLVHGWKGQVQSETFSAGVSKVASPRVSVAKSTEVRTAVLEWYTKKGVSFSRLSEFTRCPLDFYYRTILRLGEQRELEEELGASDLGDIVHKILELAYEPMVGLDRLSGAEINTAKEFYPKLLNDYIDEKGLGQVVAFGESALVHAVADRMLSNHFNRENQRVAREQIAIESLEADWHMQLDVIIDGQPVPVRFIAKIDRIERHTDGLLLIDFKTGKVASSDVSLTELTADTLFKPKKSKVFQLLYYIWFYWRYSKGTIASAAIVSLVGMEEAPLRLKLAKSETILVEQLELFESLLFNYLEVIAIEGSFEHGTEEGFYCSYCVDKAEPSWA